MELKERKRIKNTGIIEGINDLPGFVGGKQPWKTAISYANLLYNGFDSNTQNVFNRINNLQNNQQDNDNNLYKNVKNYMDLNRLAYKDAKRESILDKDTDQVNNGNGSNLGSFFSSAPSAIQNIVDSFDKYARKEDILAARDISTSNVGGIPVTIKLINTNKAGLEYWKNGKLPKYGFGKNIMGGISSGALAGSAFGTYGTVIGAAVGGIASGIGSVIASDNEAEELEKARIYNVNENLANINSAATIGMLINNAKKYGSLGDTRIYRFKCGKLPKYDIGKVATAFGLMYGEPNAKVSNGEVIAREIAPGQFSAYRVPGMKNNKDGKLALLGVNDYVISNKNGSSDIAASGNIKGAINHMIATGNPSYKCGKLPKHAEGWLGNAIPATAGVLAGLGQYLDARNSRVYRPNTYSENPYELEGLTTLAGLRINPYPIMDELRKSEARTNRAIDIAGGLSGGQRTGARLANLNTTQNNISKLLQNIQQLNNAYKANYAQAAINAGQASRQARMQANQWDLDMYSKAHAARNKGMQVGIANMLAQIQQYQANEFKRRQFNETMSLYRDDQRQRQQNFDWYRNNALNVTKTTDPIASSDYNKFLYDWYRYNQGGWRPLGK